MPESLQNLKLRKRSVENIGKITKAMELVAATKMRRSQEIALNSRPYTLTALDLLATLSRIEGVELPALLRPRPIRRTAVVVVTSDKGLAGAFNSAVLRTLEAFMAEHAVEADFGRYAFMGVGQKAVAYLERRVPALEAAFTRVGDYTTMAEVRPISDLLIEGYLGGRFDEAVIISTHFRSALRQEAIVRQVFPVDPAVLQKTARDIVPEHGRFAELVKERRVSFFGRKPEELREYLIEPSPAAVLDKLARHLVEAELYQVVLEANASEHAARRMAMKSASDNAKDLADRLSLSYNKSRQAAITNELIEITAGAESLQ